MKIYTKKGDDGTTGLLFGGRVRKDDHRIETNGAVDEAQAALGLARAEAGEGSPLDEILIGLERDLWVLMAEIATDDANRHKLEPGKNLVTEEMVLSLEARIDEIAEQTTMPADFVVPGQSRVSAALDYSRTVVRRAERLAITLIPDGSWVLKYLNRLSDLCWMLARWQEGEHLLSRGGPPSL